MGQGALSKPVVQWWLSLNSSKNRRNWLYCGGGLGFAGLGFRFRRSLGTPVLCGFRKQIFWKVRCKTSFLWFL